MKYRAEIDGLRAVAVVSVIMFHAGFSVFSGGFVGVDVFFVISGYLITTILIDEIENKEFNILHFYERRIRRILPAFIIMLLVCTLFSWFILNDSQLVEYGKTLIGASLFISNIVFWLSQGYFLESSEIIPLLHTWSLAVEEQFYITFPVFLCFLMPICKGRSFWVIFILALLSFILCEWGWRNHPTANFYLAPTRAWELLAGSISSYAVRAEFFRANNILSLLGLFFILLAVFVYDYTTPFPSFYAMLPVVGAVLIIIFSSSDVYVSRILASKPFIFIGLLSYSAYLWHQPVFAFFRISNVNIKMQPKESALLVVFVFIISYISWRFVESPFRKRDFLIRNKIFYYSFISLSFVVFLGFIPKYLMGAYEYKLAALLAKNKFVYYQNMDDRKFIEGRLMFDLGNFDHVLVGSSRIMQINSQMMGAPILNLGVSGASIEDDIAFLLEAVAKLSPKSVFISADPWLLNKFDGQDRYKSTDELYAYWLEKLENGDQYMQPFYSGDSLYAKSKRTTLNWHDVILNIRPDRNIVPIDGSMEAYSKKAYDGHHIYSQEYRKKRLLRTEEILSYVDYSMKPFFYESISEERLKALIKYLKIHGVHFTFILSPYHPKVYSFMKSERPIFLELEKRFRQIASDSNVSIIGSYDPHMVGCFANEFYDGMHPDEDCMFKILQTYN